MIVAHPNQYAKLISHCNQKLESGEPTQVVEAIPRNGKITIRTSDILIFLLATAAFTVLVLYALNKLFPL